MQTFVAMKSHKICPGGWILYEIITKLSTNINRCPCKCVMLGLFIINYVSGLLPDLAVGSLEMSERFLILN